MDPRFSSRHRPDRGRRGERGSTGQLLQALQNCRDAFPRAHLVSAQFQFRIQRRFVRRGDSGEVFDFSGACFGIKPFRVALLAHFHRHVEVDLDEFSLRSDVPREVAVGTVRGNEGGDANETRFGKESGYLANAADVFFAVSRRKAEVRAKAMAHVVAVEHESVFALGKQIAFELDGDCGLARGAQSGEPHDAAGMAVLTGALLGSDFAPRPSDVFAFV